MRGLPICAEILEMSSNQSLEVCSESRIERMKKLLSSPLTKKKSSGQGKMFGSTLEVLVQRESSQMNVPFIVIRICQYIEKHGMTHEGIFRISGNARLVEKLKTAFDHSGDAPLETEGDVASAGALLKLFLRELSDPVIPSSAQPSFLEAVRANVQDKEKTVRLLKCLVGHLPEENYAILKYLMNFLHRVAELEELNRMSASSLGIVFGPNLFRVSDDFSGLKDQAVTNQIAMTFISKYSIIFEETMVSYSAMDQTQFSMIKSVTEPLSVLIPPMEEMLVIQGSDQRKSTQLPLLLVDSFNDPAIHKAIDEQLYGRDRSSKVVSTPSRRKRKERKFSGDDITVMRSNSEERSFQDETKANKLAVAVGGERLRRCSSHEEVRSMEIECPIYSIQQKPRRKSSAEVVGVNLTLSSAGLVLSTLNQDLSPHPPKPKRRELENITMTTLQRDAREISSDHDFHELQRSAERTAPHQHGKTSRSRRTSSRSIRFQKVQTSESSDDEQRMSMEENVWKKASKSDNLKSEERILSQDESHDKQSSMDWKQLDSKITDPPVGDKNTQGILGLNLKKEDEQESWQSQMFASYGADDLPPLDLNALHKHGDGSEPLLSEHRFSWPLVKPTHDEAALLSPSAPFMRKTNSLQFDPSMPPSPPVEQDDVMIKSIKEEESLASNLKQLTKKIHSLRKKIKLFEESFEFEHGFRPSHAEKMNYPEVKKMLLDFSKARKEFRQLKEESYAGETYESLRDQKNGFKSSDYSFPTVCESLSKAQRYLTDSRRSGQRPEEFEEMSKEQIQEEKTAMQKALLQFESVHGRPTSKLDRDMMRPLYERYRKVKRIARLGASGTAIGGNSAGIMKGKELVGTELQPILEHVAMDFTSPQHRRISEGNQLVPDISEDLEDQDDVIQEEEQQNLVLEDQPTKQQEAEESKMDLVNSSNLHELPLAELIRQLQKTRAEKRLLKRAVREFEEEFQRQNGRRAQKEDRNPVETVYGDYKHIKARLKLLEALVSKHEHHRMI